MDVTLSHKRGFYDAAFDLKLTCADAAARIRFTTNGLPPTESSGLVYSEPISIKGTTVLRVGAFKADADPGKIKTHTFIFPADLGQQSPDGLPPAGWPIEWGENRVDYGMDPRVVNDPRYRNQLAEGFKSLPSFSLVMDVMDLFDRERGIYSNARNDGRETERVCSLELIHPDGADGFQTDCGVRIRGGFSRMPFNPKHAFRFFFRKQYGGGKLKHPLFGKDGMDTFDNIDLRCSQNYSWSLAGDPRGLFLRDQFNRDLQLAMDQPAARGNFYHLFINGIYWGLFNTCERPEASYAETYFGGQKEDYDVIKPRGGGFGREGNMPFMTDGNIDAWRKLYDAAKAGLGSSEAYFRLQGLNADGTPNPAHEPLLDPVNLIDYMLVIFYGGNRDAPISAFMGNQGANNWYGIRSRKGGHGFRFFVWDAEHTLLEVDDDRTGPFSGGDEFEQSNPQWLWQRCCDNPEFRLLLADRVQKHFFNEGVLTPKSVAVRFQRRAHEIEKAVVCESARWGDAQPGGGFGGGPRVGPDGKEITGPLTQEDWRREVERVLKEFIPKRSDFIVGQLFHLGMLPDMAPPRFNQHGGSTAAGFKVEMTAPKGKIYFTLDGSDPRLIGGKISPKARAYESPVPLAQTATIKSRTLFGEDWSSLSEASFVVGQ